ncbi:adenine phosphoribosyltransferase-like [Argonauta hians]
MTETIAEDEIVTNVRKTMKYFPDFPKKGIVFCDIFPVLQNPPVFKGLITKMVDVIKQKAPEVELIVGLESRGFLFGPLIATELNIGFVPVRKKGKLPGPTTSVDYQLEYGQASFELQSTAVKAKQKVVIVDDLLATGGTLAAAVQLLKQQQAMVQLCMVVIELECFIGKRPPTAAPIHSILVV